MVLTLVFGLMFVAAGTIAHWPQKTDARAALLDAIAAARLTPKEVYSALGYTQSHWSKIERGEAPLPPLDRLVGDPARPDRQGLPPAVWDHLFPRMAYVVWSRRQQPSEERSA